MSRRLIVAAILVAAPAVARAGELPELGSTDPGDQGLGAVIGIATGSHLTPGGLRVTGHYTYRLSHDDWFDGAAAFTFGASGAACFTDRGGNYVCDHGLLDGRHLEAIAAVRHYFDPQGILRPFARGGLGVGIARFADDGVTGLTLALHAGGGLRAEIVPAFAIVAEADLALGVGLFGHSIGAAPDVGLAIVAGVEFRL